MRHTRVSTSTSCQALCARSPAYRRAGRAVDVGELTSPPPMEVSDEHAQARRERPSWRCRVSRRRVHRAGRDVAVRAGGPGGRDRGGSVGAATRAGAAVPVRRGGDRCRRPPVRGRAGGRGRGRRARRRRVRRGAGGAGGRGRAARHLRSVGTWSSDSEAPALATADTTQWLEQLAGDTYPRPRCPRGAFRGPPGGLAAGRRAGGGFRRHRAGRLHGSGGRESCGSVGR